MELQQLVEANKVFALHYFGLEGHPEVDPSMLELKLPQGWEWNANFKLLQHAASHFGIPWAN
jgi:hypothetical protein